MQHAFSIVGDIVFIDDKNNVMRRAERVHALRCPACERRSSFHRAVHSAHAGIPPGLDRFEAMESSRHCSHEEGAEELPLINPFGTYNSWRKVVACSRIPFRL